MNILEEVITFKEASEYLGCVPSYLNYLVSTGKLIEGVHYRTAGRIKLILKEVVKQMDKEFKI